MKVTIRGSLHKFIRINFLNLNERKGNTECLPQCATVTLNDALILWMTSGGRTTGLTWYLNISGACSQNPTLPSFDIYFYQLFLWRKFDYKFRPNFEIFIMVLAKLTKRIYYWAIICSKIIQNSSKQVVDVYLCTVAANKLTISCIVKRFRDSDLLDVKKHKRE